MATRETRAIPSYANDGGNLLIIVQSQLWQARYVKLKSDLEHLSVEDFRLYKAMQKWYLDIGRNTLLSQRRTTFARIRRNSEQRFRGLTTDVTLTQVID